MHHMKCLHYTDVIQLISISTYSKTKLLRKKLVQDFRLDGLADKQSTVSQHSRKLKALMLLSEKHSVDSFFVDPSTHFCIKGTSCFNLSGCLTTQPFNGLFSKTTWVSLYQKGKPIWILLEQDTVSGSGISWATCKSAPRSRQITTPAPHHSVFYRPDALPGTQPTVSKHWRLSD